MKLKWHSKTVDLKRSLHKPNFLFIIFSFFYFTIISSIVIKLFLKIAYSYLILKLLLKIYKKREIIRIDSILIVFCFIHHHPSFFFVARRGCGYLLLHFQCLPFFSFLLGHFWFLCSWMPLRNQQCL